MIPLLILTIVCMFYFVLISHKRMLQRLFFAGFFLIGILFILRPEFSTELANSIGIGRGVDLILYLSTLFLFFAAFNFYIRFRMLDERLTQLVRSLTLAFPYKQPLPPIAQEMMDSSQSLESPNMPIEVPLSIGLPCLRKN